MNIHSISPLLVERLGCVLVHSLWQFTLIALLAAAIVQTIRQNSASIRYIILVGALAASVIASVATWTLLPTNTPAPVVERDVNSTTEFDPEGSVETFFLDTAEALATPTSEHDVAAEPNVSDDSYRPSSPSTRESSVVNVSWREQAVRSFQPWLVWIVAGWCVGVALYSLRPLLGWYTLRRLQRVGVSPVSDELLASVQRVSGRLGLKRTVRVLQSTLTRVPIVAGYFRPVVLLPVSLVTNMPTAQLEAILAHELAHVRRHDFFVNVLQTLVETVFFYHPAVWWLSRQVRAEREHSCDDIVVDVLENRIAYGRALLAVAELRSCDSALAVGATDGSLLARIRRIVGVRPQQTVPSLANRAPAAMLTVLLLGISTVSWMAWNLSANDEVNPSQNGSSELKPTAGDQKQVGVKPNKEKTKVVPRKGLEFLRPYPKLHELSLDMTEEQFLAIVKRNELKPRKRRDGGSNHYTIATDDDHIVIVMFGNNGDKCSGIQRLRGQLADVTPAKKGIALSDAVREFNEENKELGRGLDQAPLTVDEVVRAIQSSDWKRDASDLSEREFQAFEAVATSRRLPDKSYVRVWTQSRSGPLTVVHLWQIQLYLPALDRDGFVHLKIRDTKIGEEKINPMFVAWGKPDLDGLSLGLYLMPKKDLYEIGDRVQLRLFVRNDGEKAIENMTFYNITWPGPKSFTIVDETGEQVAVNNGHEDWSGPGWIAGAMAGSLRRGDVHAFRVPFEIGIGGGGSNKLVGLVVNARPGQTLTMRVRAHNGSGRKRTKDEPKFPGTGNLTIKVAAAKAIRGKRKEATVVGTVVTPDGKPAEGIEVLAFKGGKQLAPTFTTDERGQFRVPKAWREAEQWLTVVARDGRERLGWFDFMIHGHTDVGQKPKDGSFRLVLLPMSRTIRGRITDEVGKPLARIPIRINQLSHDVNMFAVHWRYQKVGDEPLVMGATTDDDGRFALKVPADTFAWLGTSHADWVDHSMRVPKDQTKVADVKLVRAAKISGRVIDSRSGKPIAGVRIGAHAKKTELFQSSGADATTDDNGEYVIHGLRSGEFQVQLVGGAEKTLTAPAFGAAKLESGKTFRADFSLSVGKRLAGQVLDMDTGKPIPNCQVKYTGPACPGFDGLSAETNELGEFEFFVPPGKSRLDSSIGRRYGRESSLVVDVPADGDPALVTLKVGQESESVPGSFKIFVGPALDRKVSADFEREPLVKVLEKICESAGLKLDLDVDGLKSEGYAKNMSVTIDVDGVTLQDALKQTLSFSDKLDFLLVKNKIFVSTRENIKARKKK